MTRGRGAELTSDMLSLRTTDLLKQSCIVPLKLIMEPGSAKKVQKPEGDSPKDGLQEPEDEERSGGDLPVPLAEEE